MDTVVVSTYSEMADTYDGSENGRSCWGMDTEKLLARIRLRETDRLAADVGCGTGGPLAHLARTAPAGTRLVGVEPAENMRMRALELTRALPNVEVREGSFESLPLEDASADYLFSIHAFHWCSDAAAGVRELARVLRPGGRMDHFLVGRHIGREFVRATTPVFLRHMGPKRLLEATRLRLALTRDEAAALFAEGFGEARVRVEESYETYYDTVEGHLGWWVRIQPQLLGIPEERREACERDVRDALRALETDRGVPYTKHTLHVRVE